MAALNDTGILLRLRKFSETSLIANWLTAGHGRIATMAKGARRPKSPFAGKLDLFHRCDLAFDRSRTSTLHGLREVAVLDTHAALRADLLSLRLAACGVELVELLTEPEAAMPEVFHAFGGYLAALADGEASPAKLLAFEGEMLAIEGLAGAGDVPLQNAGALALRRAAAANEHTLLNHCGRVPRSRAALLEELGIGGARTDSRA